MMISVKDAIYQKRKKGKMMSVDDVKRTLFKNLNITRVREMAANNIATFDNRWKLFNDILRMDNNKKNSWYML